MGAHFDILDAEGVVINTIVASAEFMAENYAEGTYRLADVQPEPSIEAAVRRVTKLAFRNRFMTAEKVAIEIAGLDDPGAPMPQRALAAAVRASQADVAAATFIDLDRTDTRAGVEQLEAAGLLAPGRAAEILDAPIEPHEVYQ